ncbi:hypothetical protein JFU18_28655 [Bacillus sp. TH22]|uniref:Uncharacterized protein n=2 Tax=Bacillus cereus group TaxID=86661 RepID=A0A1S9TGX5_BACCE|nr:MULTISPECIES: hypothetical protein [Bacillus]ARJ25454.1 hypothetical protein B7492_30790 [Bacillus mycoides]MBK5452413.1 hypothetical protein [Bacillus sp. TH22]MBK5457671.1 hypothetical protein [Bacillus sp. TH23]MED1380997.1 hypothetical protein [Bacillus mycoides]OOR09223.1 hypothetical protein BW897_28720 [Bacillus cereus]
MKIKMNIHMDDLEKSIKDKAETAIKDGKTGTTTQIECTSCKKEFEIVAKEGTVKCPHCNEEINISLNIKYDN